jgi:predicted negative regulator of RcsB-dependent stress response
MTHPITNESIRDEPKVEGFMDWFHVNQRWVGVGAVVVLVAILGGWYVTRSKTLKNENADKQLLLAKQSVASGNTPLAESDLQKVADRFNGTPAGAEAGLMLGQIKLDKADYQGAATYLQQLADKLDGPNAAAARGLLGDALSQLGKPAEAAAAYERAASETTMPNEKVLLLAKAGHAYLTAGKSPEARKIWEALAVQQDNQAVATEAHVRLGEMSAQPAGG